MNEPMTTNELTDIEGTELDDRDVRALTESMVVLPEGGDVFTVVGENGGGEYQVDAREGRCTCPDDQYNLPTDDGRETCKHAARVAFATGQRPIPAWVDTSAVDPVLGEHTDETPRRAASDGGVVETTDDTTESDDGDERPSDCDCGDWNDGEGLPCWPCYRDGFEAPA